jgi:glycosyltransferase involved in cell wall biosynthesis
MRVTHVITGLGAGGAEAMLYKLISATRTDTVHTVVSLMDEGLSGPRLMQEGISVTCLGLRRGAPTASALVSLVRLLRRERPDIVQSWMYHADLLAGLAGVLSRIPVVWGIHYSNVDPRQVKPMTRWTRAACALLSGCLADRIVCCGDSALRAHAELGYRVDRMVAIPNGFEVERFRPDPVARAQLRAELGITARAPMVGLVARFHPDKDHQNFIAAARLVAKRAKDVLFLLVGDGADWSNAELCRWIDEAGLRSRVRLLGQRSDSPRVLAGLDVLVSSSRTEGFPQVIGEAMLCGVPCVATDCGDSREIVGEAGRVVAVRDPEALAGAILEVLELTPDQRATLGGAARQRIQTRYDITSVAHRYVTLYDEVVQARRRHASAGDGGRASR